MGNLGMGGDLMQDPMMANLDSYDQFGNINEYDMMGDG